jgi:hypothetical protein
VNAAEIATCLLIERALAGSPAFRQIDDRLYIVKQGSCFVMINVLPWGADRAVVRCVAQLVKGVRLAPQLARQLLELNSILRFGAFGYVPEDELVLFMHSILGGPTLDAEELLITLRDVALVADEYDDRIARHFGGQTMQELLEESALTRLLERDPTTFEFKN